MLHGPRKPGGGAPRFGPDDHPEIKYPCAWSYTLIGDDEGQVRAAVQEMIAGRKHELYLANRKGKYCSFHLELSVNDERDRIGLFEAFGAQPAIRYVL